MLQARLELLGKTYMVSSTVCSVHIVCTVCTVCSVCTVCTECTIHDVEYHTAHCFPSG